MATQIKIRRDSYTNWYNVNPTLANGEPGWDTTNKKLKIGDGVTAWRTLAYFDDQITDFSAVAQNIVPSTDNVRTLGTPDKRWNHLYVGPGSITIGDAVLTIDQGKLNSSVGFAVDSLTLNGVDLTINQSGQVESSAGFAVAPSDVLPSNAAGVLTNNGSGVLSWVAGGGGGSANLGNLTVTDSRITTSDANMDIIVGDTNATYGALQVTSNTSNIYAENDQDGTNPGWAWVQTECTDHTAPTAFIDITPSDTGIARRWLFDKDGTLTLPGDSDITVPAATDGERQGRDIRIQGVRGYGQWGTNNVEGYAGEGSSILLTAGRGGESASQAGGEGGAIELRSGIGNGGGNGGTMYLYGGDAEWGDTNTVSGGDISIQAGNALSNVGDFGLGGNVDIKAGSGTLNNGRVRIRTNNGTSTWNFNNDGSLQMPNGYSLLAAQNTTVSAGSAPTVVYTSLDSVIGTIKATIKVYTEQAAIGGDYDLDTQVCEMLVATKRRFIDNGGTWIKTAVGSVYGVTHTSDAPLATFTVNFIQNFQVSPGITRDVVQILAEPTAAVTGTYMYVQVAATEMTND